jgi:hypothetical protein
MMLTDLADACRKSGLEVTEVDGWRTRGHGGMTSVQTIVCHHTATSKAADGDYPSMGVVRDGRTGLPGPLAQLGLGRSGRVYVIAAGVSYHAGEVLNSSQDNWHAIGIEAEHDGLSPWPAPLVDAYALLVRALLDHYGLDVHRAQGHKEIARPLGRKTDPNFDMDAFRERVLTSGDDMPFTESQLRQIIREEVDAALDEQLDTTVIDNPTGTGKRKRATLGALLFEIRQAVQARR